MTPPTTKEKTDNEDVDANDDYAGEEEDGKREDNGDDLVDTEEDDGDEDKAEQAPDSSTGHAKMARAKRHKASKLPAK